MRNLTKERAEALKNKIVKISPYGMIEDVYGTSTSFNVFSRNGAIKTRIFYKSAYSLNSAKQILNELAKID